MRVQCVGLTTNFEMGAYNQKDYYKLGACKILQMLNIGIRVSLKPISKKLFLIKRVEFLDWVET